jgi:hypothetical protein
MIGQKIAENPDDRILEGKEPKPVDPINFQVPVFCFLLSLALVCFC